MKMLAAFLLALAAAAGSATAQPRSILFVGNSFTYTRPPALQYNVGNVLDLNYANFLANPAGADPALPQPWGGVPGIFEALARQAGLAYDVHHSLRGGATLRGHYLNTNPAGWDLRANIGARAWDVVVLQGNSTEALPRAGGDLPEFLAYVDLLERWIHVGDARSYREADLYPGGSRTRRDIPANPNASAATAIYLYQTWARPDLTYPPGEPYSGEPLEAMTAELRDHYALAAAGNDGIDGVAPVGEAFLRAVRDGVALRNPYQPEGRGVDLWWHQDQFHSSVHGSYLAALVLFGSVTGVDPASFGASERAASELGIARVDALRLQRVASEQLRASAYGLAREACLHAAPSSQGARPCVR